MAGLPERKVPMAAKKINEQKDFQNTELSKGPFDNSPFENEILQNNNKFYLEYLWLEFKKIKVRSESQWENELSNHTSENLGISPLNSHWPTDIQYKMYSNRIL